MKATRSGLDRGRTFTGMSVGIRERCSMNVRAASESGFSPPFNPTKAARRLVPGS
jgi:hypothetical protein